MREIACSRGLVALVDDADYEELNQYRWFARPQRNTFYAYRHDTDQKRSTIFMHRQIVRPREGLIVNRRDGNGLNNQRENLREATRTQQQQSRGANNGRPLKGATWVPSKRRWKVRVAVEGKRLNRFARTLEEAARLYDELAVQYYGEFARTNWLPDGDPRRRGGYG